MDKTINISLGGFAFNIDDAAYNILRKYLSDIRVSLRNSPGVDEIISDIEYRMAELLRERMMGREVVNPSDITYLVEVMGKPEEFYNDEFLDDEESSEQTYRSPYVRSGAHKKLFRDPDDKILGGVCSGIGHYLGIDAIWVRLLFILLPFLDIVFLGLSTSMVIFIYFILWLVIPLAKSTSDKLQMRGEPVNVDSIKDFFGNSPENVRNNIKDFSDDARRVANNSGNAIGNLIRIFVKIVAAFFILILLIIALALLFAFIVTLFGLGAAGFGIGIAGFSLNEYLPFIFEGNWEQILGYLSLALVMVIPAIGLVLVALRLISKRYSVPRYVGFSLPILWLLGLTGLIIVSVATLRNFQTTSTKIETVNVPTNATTLILQRDDQSDDFDIEDVFQVKDGLFAVPVSDDVTLKQSTSEHAYMEIKLSGKGRSESIAAKNLAQMKYNYNVNDSLVRLENYLFLKEGQQWRNQKVKTTFYLPEGKNIIFRNVDDVESYENGSFNRHDVDSENIYTFDNNILKCINCPGFGGVTPKSSTSIQIEDSVSDIVNDKDSVIINTNKNGTSNINISSESDSITN